MKSAAIDAPGLTDAFSRDAFHRGKFWLVQPLSSGHRAGMDAMMLAATVPTDFSGRVADFGAGAGAAGLAVLARCPRTQAVLIENAPQMLRCAGLTLADPANAAIAPRASLLDADLTLAGKTRIAAGLADNSFDCVVMNPPFNARADRPTPDILKRAAHVMHDGLFESWIKTAAALVRPRGMLAVIARPEMLPDLLEALSGRFGHAEILPIHPRDDKAAIRIVVRAVRASRAGLKLLPPLFLHDRGSDRFSERTDDINNGRASLFGD